MTTVVERRGRQVILRGPALVVVERGATLPHAATIVVAERTGPAGPPGPQGGTDLIDLHLIDPTPHPVYDDMPDLSLLFDNALI